MNKPIDIDNYIAGFPAEIQALLKQVRETVQKAAPDAQEAISYGMPTFTLAGNLVHFAAFSNHIGFYSTPSGTKEFNERLSGYKGGKGSVRFPLDKPLPLDLITEIVKIRVAENVKKAEEKPKKQKTSHAKKTV